MAALIVFLCAFLLVTTAAETEAPKDDGEEIDCNDPESRYPKLMKSAEEIHEMIDFEKHPDAHKIEKFESEVQINGTSFPVDDPKGKSKVQLPACYDQSQFADPCCRTIMYYYRPYWVVNIYNGKSYRVKDYGFYNQYLHVGVCERPYAWCAVKPWNGYCDVIYRVQWILVEVDYWYRGYYSDMYVPVSVPNHCYCRNTW